MNTPPHRAGFVALIGKPNVGKSTLMNTLVGEKLSVITAKAQTTRHQIVGILSSNNFQIVYTDTPGISNPNDALQKSMARAVRNALVGADVLLWVVDVWDSDPATELKKKIQQKTIPTFVLINKVDLADQATLYKVLEYWTRHVPAEVIIPISALRAHNTELVLEHILDCLPEHPPYYPKDMLTDKSERFFAAEIIREKILLNYYQEVPHSVEVVIETFREEAKLIRIGAVINVEKQSQKSILIGKNGIALKKVGTAARQDLEQFLGKQVFLEQHVKVASQWRSQSGLLHQFGYV